MPDIKYYFFKDHANPKICEIRNEGLSFLKKHGYIKDLHKCIDPGSSAIVAKDCETDENVGMIAFVKIPRQTVCWMSFVYIKPEYQGCGIFKEMFGKFIKVTKHLYSDCETIEWGCHKKNDKAYDVYKRMGATVGPYLDMNYTRFVYHI